MMLNKPLDMFYRYEIRTYASMNDGYVPNNKYNKDTRLVLVEFNLLRETPKGYWIGDEFSPTWVSKTSKKRYAYPTKEEAINNFIKRTLIRKNILEEHLSNCIMGLNQANNILETENN